MYLKQIILWGGTGQAKVLSEFLPRIGYRVAVVFDNDEGVSAPLPNVPLYFGERGFEAWIRHRSTSDYSCLVTIGGARGEDRLHRQEWLTHRGVKPIIAIHPSAVVANNASIGEGTQILAGAILGAEASVGRACIINSKASVDHECILADGVHVAPGATLAGCVRVGPNTLIGTGAIILPRICVGANVTVGGGAVVTTDLADGTTAYGNPARIRSHP